MGERSKRPRIVACTEIGGGMACFGQRRERMIQSEFPHAGLEHGSILHPKRVRDSLARRFWQAYPGLATNMPLCRNGCRDGLQFGAFFFFSFTLGKVLTSSVTQPFVLDMGANVGVEGRPRGIKPMEPPPLLQGRTFEGRVIPA